MFTIRQKLLLCGSVLFSVLFVAGSYFGSRWLHGPDVEPLPEHLLSDRPRAVSMNRPVRAYGSQYTPSVFESESVSHIDSTLETEQNYNDEEEELETLLNFLSDEELTALVEAFEQAEGKSSDFPEVPDGFPSNLKPVWLKDYFHKDDFSGHVIMDRVLIELWNRGDHDFVNGVLENGKVYPLYPGVVYVSWNSYVRESHDGESVEVPYISGALGVPTTVNPLFDSGETPFTAEEIMSGAYKTKYPDIEFVNFDDAGYDPETILNDY